MLNDLAKQAYSNAKSRGFYPEDADIKNNLFEIISEVAEIGKAHRDNKRVSKDKKSLFVLDAKADGAFKNKYESYVKDTLEQELSGAIIALLSVSKSLDVDIEKFINYEMRYNEIRGNS